MEEISLRLVNSRNVLPQVAGYPVNEDIEAVFVDGDHVLTKEEAEKRGIEKIALAAVENLEHKGIIIAPLEKMVGEDDTETNVWVVSTSDAKWGAAAILLQTVIDKIRNLPNFENGFYIIPSSVHELLVLPKGEIPPSALVKMIRDVNRREVLPGEVLSDHLLEIKAGKLVISA